MKAAAPARKLMTAEEFADYAALPQNENRWLELVRGEVIELPVPKKLHGKACGRFAGHLFLYAQQKGWGYITSNDPGIVLERDPDTVRGPDVAFYQEEDEEEGYSEVPPLLAVEVLSPDDRPSRILRKIAEYLDNGVKLVWVADPAERSIAVHQPDKPMRILKGDDDITGEDILLGFRCKVADFFPRPKGWRNGKPKRKRH